MRIIIFILVTVITINLIRNNRGVKRILKPITTAISESVEPDPNRKLPPIGQGTALVGAKLEPAKAFNKKRTR